MSTEVLVCQAPIKQGPNKGKPATGTLGGATRHYKAGQKPCEPCREASVMAQRGRVGYQGVGRIGRPKGKHREMCLRNLHRMEGDNIYVQPSTGHWQCQACIDLMSRMRRVSAECTNCGQWFLDEEAFDLHLHYPSDKLGRPIRGAASDRCLTQDEMRDVGLVRSPDRAGLPKWKRTGVSL